MAVPSRGDHLHSKYPFTVREEEYPTWVDLFALKKKGSAVGPGPLWRIGFSLNISEFMAMVDGKISPKEQVNLSKSRIHVFNANVNVY